jgi:hypothetical protein
MLTFGITRCRPFQSIPLLNLGIRSSVSATAGSIAGTGFLELCVGWSVILPEFVTFWKQCPFSFYFIFRNKKKLQGAKSGE